MKKLLYIYEEERRVQVGSPLIEFGIEKSFLKLSKKSRYSLARKFKQQFFKAQNFRENSNILGAKIQSTKYFFTSIYTRDYFDFGAKIQIVILDIIFFMHVKNG